MILPLGSDSFYHLYNRAVGDELLFRRPEDYDAFLTRMKTYLSPAFDFYAYCLLPNHFHFLVRTSDKELPFSKICSDCFNSYSKWFNKEHTRKGGLFMTPFQRNKIETDDSFTRVVYYVHRNPVHHFLTKAIADWPHSSYHSIISDGATLLKRQEVLDWFYGREKFIEYHNAIQDGFLSGFD